MDLSRLHGSVMVETGYPLGQDGLDPVKNRAGLTAVREFLPLKAIPARALDKIAYFKVKLVAVGQNFIHVRNFTFGLMPVAFCFLYTMV
ncbi:MAG: hypothetical protein ACOZBW_09625 [Thermodesulfobacteriota bacterium]